MPESITVPPVNVLPTLVSVTLPLAKTWEIAAPEPVPGSWPVTLPLFGAPLVPVVAGMPMTNGPVPLTAPSTVSVVPDTAPKPPPLVPRTTG